MPPFTKKARVCKPHYTRADRNQIMPKRATAAMWPDDKYGRFHKLLMQVFDDASRSTTWLSMPKAKPSFSRESIPLGLCEAQAAGQSHLSGSMVRSIPEPEFSQSHCFLGISHAHLCARPYKRYKEFSAWRRFQLPLRSYRSSGPCPDGPPY